MEWFPFFEISACRYRYIVRILVRKIEVLEAATKIFDLQQSLAGGIFQGRQRVSADPEIKHQVLIQCLFSPPTLLL
ncbi:MAG: hypothetical protein EBY24_07675 [Betaproteobacteria bacterium]|nr:hypothetical protein [Betaproteobacteria bacterium]